MLKQNCHDITEILLKVSLHTITPKPIKTECGTVADQIEQYKSHDEHKNMLKQNCHDITEILLKVALHTITPKPIKTEGQTNQNVEQWQIK